MLQNFSLAVSLGCVLSVKLLTPPRSSDSLRVVIGPSVLKPFGKLVKMHFPKPQLSPVEPECLEIWGLELYF